MFDQLLTTYLMGDFWPSYLFVNGYPVLAVFWNVFLGVLPLGILFLMKSAMPEGGQMTFVRKFNSKALFALWLLFLPNSAYMITEIRHLSGMYDRINVFNREMYDVWVIIFFFGYSFLGYLLYYYNVIRMLSFVESKFFADRSIMLPIISFFSAWGVLVGLVGRWNSWEVFMNPIRIYNDLIRYFTEWEYFRNLIIYFLFLYISHLAISSFIKRVYRLS